METQTSAKRQRIDSIIEKFENISNIDEVIPYLDCIGIDNVKHYVVNTLTNEILNSTQIANRLFLVTDSIENIFCVDLIQSIVCYLNPKEIHCSIALLNQEFNQLLKKETMVKKLLYYHPMFTQIFEMYHNEYFIKHKKKFVEHDYMGRVCKTFIGSKMQYTLQNEYDAKTLNECLNNWKKLGETLYGHDRYVWNLCNYCELRTVLCGEIDGDCDNYYTNCFQDIDTGYESFGMYDDEIDYLNMDRTDLNGGINEDGLPDVVITSRYKHREFYHSIIPTLLIDLPDTKFRNKIKKVVNDDNDDNDDSDDERPQIDQFYEKEKIQQFGMWF